MSTKVVHCKRHKYDIYIGRPGIWGNPFSIGRDGTRQQVIDKYREFINGTSNKAKELKLQLHTLKGKTLGCWCSPQACHGDVLAELADSIS